MGYLIGFVAVVVIVVLIFAALLNSATTHARTRIERDVRPVIVTHHTDSRVVGCREMFAVIGFVAICACCILIGVAMSGLG